MSISMYDASAPILVNILTNMRSWLERDDVKAAETTLLGARLFEDMRPLTAQYQMASDSAKNGMGRLAGVEIPGMPDTESSLAELRQRCDNTIAFVQSITVAQMEGSETREVVLKFPSGNGYSFTGLDYLTRFMLPNFFFHATTAYAILRAQGIAIGKPDFLAHMGPPNLVAEPA
jgi:uncharacterized protein